MYKNRYENTPKPLRTNTVMKLVLTWDQAFQRKSILDFPLQHYRLCEEIEKLCISLILQRHSQKNTFTIKFLR